MLQFLAALHISMHDKFCHILLGDILLLEVKMINLPRNFVSFSIILILLTSLVFSQDDSDHKLPFIHRYIQDIEISHDYSHDHTLFSLVFQSGVFKSTDEGNTWISANNGIANFDICDIAISPNFKNDQTIMALTTTNDPNDYGFLLVSNDGGEQWEQRAKFQGIRNAILVMSPNIVDDKTVFFIERNSIWASTDLGHNWPYHSLSSVEGGAINCIEFSPDYANDNTIFISTHSNSSGGGLYISNNNAKTWTRIGRKLITNWWTDESFEALVVSPNFSTDNTFFSTLVDGFQGTIGFWRSFDRGVTIDSLRLEKWGGGTSGITNRGISTMVISPDFENDKLLYLGTAVGIYRSYDNAEIWTSMNNGLGNIVIESL